MRMSNNKNISVSTSDVKSSSTARQKILLMRLNPSEKSILEIGMLRNNVTNYSGYIRSKLFKYETQNIQNSIEEFEPNYQNLPDDLKETVEKSYRIQLERISQYLFEIMSIYNSIVDRYTNDCNSTVIRDTIKTEKVLDSVKLENKFRELTYRISEFGRKTEFFFEFINADFYKSNRNRIPVLPETFNSNPEEVDKPILKFYYQTFNKNSVHISFTKEEYTKLEEIKNNAGRKLMLVFIKDKVIGKPRELSNRIHDILMSKNVAEQVIVLANFAESLTSKIKYSAYKYAKKMEALKENPKISKYRREAFVIDIFKKILQEENDVEMMLNKIIFSHSLNYKPKPFNEKSAEEYIDTYETENDYEIAQKLAEEFNSKL